MIEPTTKQKMPTQTLLQGKPFNKHTNVQDTWRKFGWTPTHPDIAGTMDTVTIYETKKENQDG